MLVLFICQKNQNCKKIQQPCNAFHVPSKFPPRKWESQIYKSLNCMTTCTGAAVFHFEFKLDHRCCLDESHSLESVLKEFVVSFFILYQLGFQNLGQPVQGFALQQVSCSKQVLLSDLQSSHSAAW